MNAAETIPTFLPTLRQLIGCTQAFERYSGVHVKKLGLSESRFDVIATLGNTPHGMNCKEWANARFTKGTLTGVLDRMEARGLVSRKGDAGDARRSHIVLTPTGTVLFDDAFSAHMQHLQRAFDRVPPAELISRQNDLGDLRLAFEEALA